jgi:hypothetical protein
MIYKNGPYHVDIGNDGTIHVRPGDWLSKYSAAIYNNFTTIHVFARRDKFGAVVPIQNVNLIYAGEVLYHLPTYNKFMRKPQQPQKTIRISDAEKKKIAEDFMKKEFKLSGDNLRLFSKVIDILGYADNAITLGSVANLIAEGSLIATAGTVLSVVNLFLGPIGMIIGLLNTLETPQRIAGLRAVAYGSTAWVFGDPMPAYPSDMRKEQLKWSDPWKTDQCEKAWNEARDSAVKGHEEEVVKRKIPKEAYQALMRAVSNDNRINLIKLLMKELEKQLEPNIRKTLWSIPGTNIR